MNRILFKKFKVVASIIFGNALYALSVRVFLLNSGMITGGTTGISLVLNRLWGIPVAGFVLIFNVLMLILGWIILGGRFAITTVASTFLYPMFLQIWGMLLGNIAITNDFVLCSVFSGLGIGIALGMVIRMGASTGGMDIPTLVLKKLFNIPIAVSFYVFDFAILLAQGIFTSPSIVLYGIVNVIIYTRMMDEMLMLGNSRTEVKVISDRPEEVKKAIINNIERGLTVISSRGGYTGNKKELILTVISNRQLPHLDRIVHEIDPECFMIIGRVTAVKGNGFTADKKGI